MKNYFYRRNYNSTTFKYEPYVMLCEYIYNLKTELETEINYRFDYLFRFRNLPSSDEVLDLYMLILRYEQFCLISKDLFAIIKLEARSSEQSSAKDKLEKV